MSYEEAMSPLPESERRTNPDPSYAPLNEYDVDAKKLRLREAIERWQEAISTSKRTRPPDGEGPLMAAVIKARKYRRITDVNPNYVWGPFGVGPRP